MAENILLAEQTFEGFVYDGSFNAYVYNIVSTPYELIAGETYFVKWDNTVYECVAQDMSVMSAGMVAIGNISALTGSGAGNNEPFIINYVQGANAGGFLALPPDTETSHKVGIYQVVEEEPDEPDEPDQPEDIPEEDPEEVGIIIKNRLGDDVTYYGIETVTFDTTVEGKQQTYTKGNLIGGVNIDLDLADGDQVITVPEGCLVKQATIKKPENLTQENIREGETVAGVTGTLPAYEILENVPIDLDFSNGNQTITVPNGTAVKSAIIQQPETLIPENIAEGIDIAGIIGTLQGGAGAKVAFGTISSEQSANFTVEHNLGVIPDIVVLYSSNPNKSYYRILTVGVSPAFGEMIGKTFVISYTTKSDSYYNYSSSTFDYGITATGGNLPINTANETTFRVFCNTSFKVASGTVWLAVGGLT